MTNNRNIENVKAYLSRFEFIKRSTSVDGILEKDLVLRYIQPMVLLTF